MIKVRVTLAERSELTTFARLRSTDLSTYMRDASLARPDLHTPLELALRGGECAVREIREQVQTAVTLLARLVFRVNAPDREEVLKAMAAVSRLGKGFAAIEVWYRKNGRKR